MVGGYNDSASLFYLEGHTEDCTWSSCQLCLVLKTVFCRFPILVQTFHGFHAFFYAISHTKPWGKLVV